MSDEPMHALPQAQRLALSYAPRVARGRFQTLFALEARLSGIVRSVREPMLAQLRLAWWRDRLTSPVDDWPRGDAVLDAVREWREPAGLADLVDGWEALLAGRLTSDMIEAHIAGRANAFVILGRELGVDRAEATSAAARGFVQADLLGNLSQADEREAVLAHAPAVAIPALPRMLRPLSVLAGLGRSVLRKGGGPLLASPASVFLALRIGLTGR